MKTKPGYTKEVRWQGLKTKNKKSNLAMNTQWSRFKHTGEQGTGESPKQSAEMGRKGTKRGSKRNNIPGEESTFKIKLKV